MGIFDSIKNAFSKEEPEPDVTVAPSEMLRNAEAEAAPQAAPAVEPEPAAEQDAPAGEGGGRTYIVQSGDTLWKIAEEMYGNGSNYMKIFEANDELLENPDRIFPGQELVIPDLED